MLIKQISETEIALLLLKKNKNKTKRWNKYTNKIYIYRYTAYADEFTMIRNSTLIQNLLEILFSK